VQVGLEIAPSPHTHLLSTVYLELPQSTTVDEFVTVICDAISKDKQAVIKKDQYRKTYNSHN
jgi:hypothetical protein